MFVLWQVRCLCVLLALWGCLLGCVGVARADEGTLWRNLSDPVFHPVGRNIDLANVLIPETIAQDDRGFLWVGKETGLLRWDGYRFRAYGYDQAQPDGMQDDFVQVLHRDITGRLWIGTVSGGLALYDPDRDRTVAVKLDLGARGAAHVWGIDDDGAGGIWAATGSGLYHVGRDGHVAGHLKHQPGQPASLPDDSVTAVLRDHTGTLWIGLGNGLVRGTAGNTRFVSVPLPVADTVTTKVLHLFEDSAGRIWVGTRHHGAYVIQPEPLAHDQAPRDQPPDNRARQDTGLERDTSGQADSDRSHPALVVHPIAATAAAASETDSPEITSIAEVGPGTIWLGTFGRGIVEADGATLRTRVIRHDPLVPSSLDSDTVRAVFRDRSGIIWVGTNQGLSQHFSGNGGIETAFGAAGRSRGMTDGDVGAVLMRPDGSVWVGTEGGGIDIFGPDGARLGVLEVGRVFCLAESPAGGVLVGTNNGLFAAESSGRTIRKLSVPQRPASAGVFALRAVDGTVWLGGQDDGVWNLRIEPSGAVTVLQHPTAAGLATANVRSIEVLPDGKLAVGTDDGFNLVNRMTGAAEHIPPDPANPHGLGDRHVMSFATDRHGRLWVGTDSGGISVMEGRDAAGHRLFHRLAMADGLPNNDIDKMLLDRKGRIWASTDNGFAVIDPETFAIRALRRADGVAVSAYWNGSGTATPQGYLVFGGLGGMTVFDPDRIVPWTYRPAVVVTGVRVGGKEVAVPPSGAAGEASDQGLQISPDANSLSVEFSALDLSAPALNRYAYRLVGFDRDWIETDAAHRAADYTNLPPGDFTLWLRGSNHSGMWSEPVAALHVRVLPDWFQTASFRLFVATAATLAVLCLVQGRTILLRRRQRELERQVADRTAELIASQQQLHHFAFFDVLTGLPNRRAFNERFRSMIDDACARGAAFALLLIDLDGFKQVNDSLGHDAGDELLVAAAGRMRGCLRGEDFAARLGGDEFAILVAEGADPEAVAQVCGRIVASLAEPVTTTRSTVRAGASVGAAMFPAHGSDAEELLRHVDMALYEAKRAGRGVWRWYRDTEQPAFVFDEKGTIVY
jgi:diguanylate cyclase (GGDEF)-like protein